MVNVNNCYNCKINEECDCGKMICGLEEYLSFGLYEQIKDIIIMQFNCEFYEG